MFAHANQEGLPWSWSMYPQRLALLCIMLVIYFISLMWETEGTLIWIAYLCHDHHTRSTLYHSVWSHPRIYCPFHCMYLHSPIISILLVSPPIGEHFVQSVFPYDYLICFCLWSQLLSVPIPLYLLIRYASGNRPQTSPGLLIALCELHWSLACPTPQASPCTFYNSI